MSSNEWNFSKRVISGPFRESLNLIFGFCMSVIELGFSHVALRHTLLPYLNWNVCYCFGHYFFPEWILWGCLVHDYWAYLTGCETSIPCVSVWINNLVVWNGNLILFRWAIHSQDTPWDSVLPPSPFTFIPINHPSAPLVMVFMRI